MRVLASFGEDFPLNKFWPVEGIPRDMSLVARYADGGLDTYHDQFAHDMEFFDPMHFSDLARVIVSIQRALSQSGFALMNGGQLDLHLQNLKARPEGNHLANAMRLNWPHVFAVTGGVRLVHASGQPPVAYQNSLLLADAQDVVAYQYCVERSGPCHAVAFQAPIVSMS